MRFNFLWNELTQYFLFTRGKEKDSSKQVSHKKNQALHSVYSKNLKKCSLGIIGRNLLTTYSSWVDLAENFISVKNIWRKILRCNDCPKENIVFLSRAMRISDSSYICIHLFLYYFGIFSSALCHIFLDIYFVLSCLGQIVSPLVVYPILLRWYSILTVTKKCSFSDDDDRVNPIFKKSLGLHMFLVKYRLLFLAHSCCKKILKSRVFN